MRGLTPGGPFTASFVGKCRECGEAYEPGDRIVGCGKGYGAMHAKCAKTAGMVARKATPDELERMASRITRSRATLPPAVLLDRPQPKRGRA